MWLLNGCMGVKDLLLNIALSYDNKGFQEFCLFSNQ